jgi:dCTP deaminase
MVRIMVNLFVSVKKSLKNFSENLGCWMAGKQLLAYDELVKLIEDGVIDAKPENVNGTSIDLTLHHVIRTEDTGLHNVVKLYAGESINTTERSINVGEHHVMWPGQVVLGATVERFKLPLNISAEFSLKSTLGRNFLGHMLAGWIDPGFSGTVTLELKNDNQSHSLAIAPGMFVGQVKMFRHKKVPFKFSYAAKGRYMNQNKVTQSKGLMCNE